MERPGLLLDSEYCVPLLLCDRSRTWFLVRTPRRLPSYLPPEEEPEPPMMFELDVRTDPRVPNAATTPMLACMKVELPRRWHKLNLDPRQLAYYASTTRYNIVAAGRRSVKTEAAKRRVVMGALNYSGRNNRYDDGTPGQFFACAPTHQQAKDIFWKDIVKLVPQRLLEHQDPRRDISHSNLHINLCNNCTIRVAGLDRPERIEGGFWDGGVITEYGNVRADAFDFNIRPMMIAGGWIDIEGVPEGRNHYYQLWEDAQADDTGDWKCHHWTTEDVLWRYLGREVAAKEIASAKARMDSLVYDQEFRASFINFAGQAYYRFNRNEQVAPLEYDPTLPLTFCFDFNESPGVAVICQEGSIPPEMNGGNPQRGTRVLGEVYIPRLSKTPMVCKKLVQDWGHHRGVVRYYGDATGGAGGSAQVHGSDWELVEEELLKGFGRQRLANYVTRSNPRERVRVNSMNSRLKGGDDVIRMAVDPSCKYLIRDLEGVTTKEGGSGELDKTGEENKSLTHISDALGYYIAEEFPSGGDAVVTTTETL